MQDEAGDETIISCISNRAGEVGLACVSCSEAKLQLFQIIDTTGPYRHVVSHMVRFQPTLVILLDSNHVDVSGLNQAVETACERLGCGCKHVSRGHFDDTQGWELMQQYGTLDGAVPASSPSPNMYLAVGAAGSILRLLRDDKGLPTKSLMVAFDKPDVLCQLDASSALALRVISDKGDGVKKWSLYSSIEPHLKLKAGRRLLRASLLQPLVNEPTIVERQNAIAELISLPDVQAGLQDLLTSIPTGVHQCLPAVCHVAPLTNSRNPNARLKAPSRLIQAVLKIKSVLVETQALAETLQPSNSILLAGIRKTLEKKELIELLDSINEIVDDVHCPNHYPNIGSMTQLSLCNCVKPEVNTFLDAARNRFNQLSEDLQQQREAFEQQENLPSGRLTHSKQYGWHIAVKRASLCADSAESKTSKRRKTAAPGCASITLPQGYWQLHANKTQVLCMTHELAEWNDHLNHAAQECAMLASQVLVSLQDAIEKRMSDLLQVLDSLALLDVLSGFVAYMQSQSSMCSFSRPTLCKERGLLHIVQGLHPIHGHTDSQTKERIEMLPNNVSLSSFKNFKLLLGPNYSGKSTLLAQVGLLCLMAQAGLFVPAKQMLFHPFGNILTHLTGNKDLYSTSSSMMLEAQSICHVLDRVASVKHAPLILVDELATSTSSTDGTAIAWAVAEQLIASKACTIFVSHFIELENLTRTYPSAFTSHMSCEEQEGEYKLTHKCLPGTCTETQYGLKLASRAAVPDAVIQHAMLLAKRMRKQELLRVPQTDESMHESKLMDSLHDLLVKKLLQKDNKTSNRHQAEDLWGDIVQHAGQCIK